MVRSTFDRQRNIVQCALHWNVVFGSFLDRKPSLMVSPGDVSKIDTLFAKDDDEGKLIEVIELDRLRAIVDVITKATDVTPSVRDGFVQNISFAKGAELSLPDGQHVTNPHFSSIRYPNQLSSYLHRYNGFLSVSNPIIVLLGSHLTEDLKGVWNLHYDTFEVHFYNRFWYREQCFRMRRFCVIFIGSDTISFTITKKENIVAFTLETVVLTAA